jgi:hypothetical protein
MKGKVTDKIDNKRKEAGRGSEGRVRKSYGTRKNPQSS